MSAERIFLDWFEANGGWLDPRCDLREIPGMGRGIIALEPIAENERLFAIPRSMLMNLGTSRLESDCRKIEAVFPPAGEITFDVLVKKGWCPLILMMLYENWRATAPRGEPTRGLGTSWGAYFGIMPTAFSTPMFWSEEELDALKGTDVTEKIGRDEAEADYNSIVLPYIKQYPQVFVAMAPCDAGVDAEIERYYSVELYHRMGSSILSRSFHVKRDLSHAEPEDADITSAPPEVTVVRNVPDEEKDDEDEEESGEVEEIEVDDDDEEAAEEAEEEDVADISMVPMADMLNARFESENTRLFYKREVLEMRCTKPIAKGEQLLNTYGNPPNSDLLRRYGFVDEPNRGDLVELPAGLVVDAAASHLSTKREELDARFEWACTDIGIDDVFLLSRLSKPANEPPYGSTLDFKEHLDSTQKKSLSKAVSQIPEELISFVRLLCADDAAWEKAKKRGALPNPRIDAVDANGDKSVAVADVIADAVRARLAQYPSTMDDDSQELYKGSPSEHGRMALVVRIGDKVILNEHLTVCETIAKHGNAKRESEQGGSSSKRARK
ncbi:Ribosomal lysine N-methyltransferase 4 [Malassezia cuniculi]|uniref:Ribosomal lysine N-methyltransferase 4 n=1 Tax=Malassezia cuniculi TaxID=948313 RepID=A0AAF0ET08_9BASI|nr:Ribosomal lysine N-methyltransferase 4 [Malassezia cuniculi]